MTPVRAKILVSLVSLTVGLVLCEVGLRVAHIGFPSFVRVDRTTGVAHVAGASGWFTREGQGWVEINRDGLRGPQRTRERPAGTMRIAVLGDSFTEALQVDDDRSFV